MAAQALRRWLSGSVHDVAPTLLGALLTHRTEAGTVAVRLTEVEAYDGASDPASHAWRGRTTRNAVMFGPPGQLYVYFSYGLHWCANVVCGPDGTASAVLLRAGRVVEGETLARERRGPHVADPSLARGPACLTRALGIGREQHGVDLLGDGPLTLAVGTSSETVLTGPRVGISRAVDVPWRFWSAHDDTVSAYRSAYRPSPRANLPE